MPHHQIGRPRSDALSDALHARILQVLQTHPQRVMTVARTGLERLRKADTAGQASVLIDEWDAAVRAGPQAVAALLDATGPEARRLRQASPLAGVLDARERWTIWRQVRDAP